MFNTLAYLYNIYYQNVIVIAEGDGSFFYLADITPSLNGVSPQASTNLGNVTLTDLTIITPFYCEASL